MDQNNTTSNNTFATTGVKSSVAAGLLGIFLGAFGAHNWYLGQKTKGIIHICLTGGGFIVMMLGSILLGLGASAHMAVPALLGGFLAFIAYIAMLGSGIWGLVEGIILLAQGDAALAAKGYTVATPVSYNQPTQPQAAQTSEPKTTEKSEKPESKKSTKSTSDKK